MGIVLFAVRRDRDVSVERLDLARHLLGVESLPRGERLHGLRARAGAGEPRSVCTIRERLFGSPTTQRLGAERT